MLPATYGITLLTGTALAAWLLQTGPPRTDVFLASFAVADGRVSLGSPVNISNNPGYDNQPSFTPDGRAILFTSVRGAGRPDPANSAASGSDIYRYDIASGQLSQVTSTPESQYSPTVTPAGKHVSVVRVESDGTQRLWRFGLDGTSPELVLPEIAPVGYHAWLEEGTVALFVLGQPASLQVVRTATGEARRHARNIGRSLARIPWGGISYVQRETHEGAPALVVMRLDPESGASTPLVALMPGPRDPDLAWTPDGMLLTAHGGMLYGWTRGQDGFAVVADLAPHGLATATRLAVSPRGDRIAIVAQPVPEDPGI